MYDGNDGPDSFLCSSMILYRVENQTTLIVAAYIGHALEGVRKGGREVGVKFLMDRLVDRRRCKGVKQCPYPFPLEVEVNLITLRL